MHRGIFRTLKFACRAQFFCLFILIGSASSQRTPLRLDSSDWWSCTRQEGLPISEPEQEIKFQRREPAEANFQIEGVTLGATWDFGAIRSKFGRTTEVERGDAASGRNQVCYVSSTGNVHLIFELGEVHSALYLLKDGAKWNGSELCARSQMVSESTSIASRLRLGLTAREVKNILGNPNIATPKKLLYYFEYKKKTRAEDLAKLRDANPDMSDADLAKNFEYADGEAYIEARFVSGKLNYLAISRSETY